MKTKELLSLPVGTYVCVDDMCNYRYLLDVCTFLDNQPIYRLFDYRHELDPFQPHINLEYSWINTTNKYPNKSWQGIIYMSGIRSRMNYTKDLIEELEVLGKLTTEKELFKQERNFLIERICNSSNGDYRKRFLQDKLKQIIKNAKRD